MSHLFHFSLFFSLSFGPSTKCRAVRLRASAHECSQEEEAKWDEVGGGSSREFFFRAQYSRSILVVFDFGGLPG